MCIAKAYKGVEGEPVLEQVAYLRFEDGKLVLVTLFGEKKTLDERVREIDFVKSRIELDG
jgi:predicted RNA-binding protein